MQRYKVAIKTKSGIASAMRKYCDNCGISIWKFLSSTMTERLQKPLNFSIAEIEQMQKRPYDKNAEFEIFDFGISDAIVCEKLRIIKDDYGISLNQFFLCTIAEKLKNAGYTFENKELKNPVRKNVVKLSKKSDAEKLQQSVSDLQKEFMNILMRK